MSKERTLFANEQTCILASHYVLPPSSSVSFILFRLFRHQNNPNFVYAFRCFAPFSPLASLPDAAKTASNSSGSASSISCEALTRLGSRLPIKGTDDARSSWNGLATKYPTSSNQPEKGLEILNSWGLALPLLASTVTVRW